MRLLLAGMPGSTSVEVVNLDQTMSNIVCNNLPDLLFQFSGSTGQLYKGSTPIICGGIDNIAISRCECESYEKGSWNKIASLTFCRWAAASALVNLPSGGEVILVTGGADFTDNGHVITNGMEWYDGKKWQDGARMPISLYLHCMVKLNETHVLAIGGYSGYAVDMTYYYDAYLNQWSPGPALNAGRYYHSCAVLKWNDSSSGLVERFVVVAGGSGPDYYSVLTVELLSLSDYDAVWMYGPSLPCEIKSGTMVELPNMVVLGEGYGENNTNNFYMLSSPQGPWIQINQMAKLPFHSNVGFLIPNYITNCYEANDKMTSTGGY